MRTLTEAAGTILEGEHVPFAYLVLLDLDTPVRVTTLPYTIAWDGEDWLGAGLVGTVSEIEEGATLQQYGLRLTLSAIPPEYVSQALGTHYQGRECSVWLAPFEDGVLVNDPILAWRGRLDTMDLELGGTATITVAAESRLTDWNRPRVSRYTHADQSARFPGDKGLEFVASTTDKELIWGRS